MGFFSALLVNAVGAGVIYATGGLASGIVLPWLGFSSAGIVAGTAAAGAQAYYGNMAAGSIISLCQAATAVAAIAPIPDLHDVNESPEGKLSSHATDAPAYKDKDRTVADALAKKVRVLCWIMTQPKNHKQRAAHVKATWGKRCNILLFMSTEEDASLPTVKLPVREDRNHLWSKTREAFRYIFEHHRRDADWFMKADDDTYVVVENLRYMLSGYNSRDPIYFGCRFKPYTKQGYMSGGAGYVLSREALYSFIYNALPSPHICKADPTGPEDVLMGICLANIGVKAMDSRDTFGRGRFFPFLPEGHLFPLQDKKFWYWHYIYYPSDEGLDCCSDYAVSFHYVPAQKMYELDYLIYHLRPYGITHQHSANPPVIDHNIISTTNSSTVDAKSNKPSIQNLTVKRV